MNFKRETCGSALIAFFAVFTVAAFFSFDRIPQDPGYHEFSDVESYFLIPNAANVLSNIPFVIVGVFGLISLARLNLAQLNIVRSNVLAYWALFAGAAFVGLGSGYYHLSPSNATLVWDRLPMTIAFMALYSIIICEYFCEKKYRYIIFPLLLLGIFSVFYWWVTESQGHGDLRVYAIVQFFPLATMPIIFLFFKPKFTSSSAYWVLLGSYILAKLFEHFDVQIHERLVFLSGHSIKHVLPAIGLYYLLVAYKTRKQV